MTGWNMPPGCNVSDIPGNGPEDQAAEALIDEFCNLDEEIVDLQHFEKVSVWLVKKIGEAYQQGYQQGQSDFRGAMEYLVPKRITEFMEKNALVIADSTIVGFGDSSKEEAELAEYIFKKD